MRKKIIVTFLSLLSISSICNASPLADYSFANSSLDVMIGQSDLSSTNTDQKNQSTPSCQLTVAAGLGFGGQYQISSLHINNPYHGNNRLTTHQIKIVDNLISIAGASLSVFAGASQTELTGDLTQTGAIAGAIGTLPIGPKTTAYAVITAGNRLANQEIGVSYQLNTTTELNLAYANTKYKDLQFSNNTRDTIKQKTVSLGLTYKI